MSESPDNTQQKNLLEESFQELMDTRIVRWFDRMLGSRFGVHMLPIVVLIDTYLLILPLEPILALYAIRNKHAKVWKIALVSTIMSLIGYASLYGVGYYFSEQTLSVLGGIFDREQIEAVGALLSRGFEVGGVMFSLAAVFGFTSALASVPIPLSAFTYGVGVLRLSFIPFAASFVLGRYIRYHLATYLGRAYGVKILQATLKNIYIFTFIMLVSIIILVFRFASVG